MNLSQGYLGIYVVQPRYTSNLYNVSIRLQKLYCKWFSENYSLFLIMQ